MKRRSLSEAPPALTGTRRRRLNLLHVFLEIVAPLFIAYKHIVTLTAGGQQDDIAFARLLVREQHRLLEGPNKKSFRQVPQAAIDMLLGLSHEHQGLYTGLHRFGQG